MDRILSVSWKNVWRNKKRSLIVIAARYVYHDGLASVIAETGCPVSVAQERAERALVLIQGSLVLARGLGSTAPFHRALAALPEELLAGIGDNS